MNDCLLHDIVCIAADDLQSTDAEEEEEEEDDEDNEEEDNFDEEEIKAMLEENESSQGAMTDTANTDWSAHFPSHLIFLLHAKSGYLVFYIL